jgi:hypothetical protein
LICLSTESNIAPFDVWSIYTAINLHFKKGGSYDAFKFNFKGPRLKRETFMANRNRYSFEKLARAYPKKNDLICYFMSNVIAGNVWINNMNDGTYAEWSSRIQSLDYRFNSEMSDAALLAERNCYSFDQLFKPRDKSEVPAIYKLYQAEKVSLESLVILDNLLNYTKSINNNLSDPLEISSDISHRIIKYKPFLRSEMNVEKHKKVVINLFTGVSK